MCVVCVCACPCMFAYRGLTWYPHWGPGNGRLSLWVFTLWLETEGLPMTSSPPHPPEERRDLFPALPQHLLASFLTITGDATLPSIASIALTESVSVASGTWRFQGMSASHAKENNTTETRLGWFSCGEINVGLFHHDWTPWPGHTIINIIINNNDSMNWKCCVCLRCCVKKFVRCRCLHLYVCRFIVLLQWLTRAKHNPTV